MDIKQSLHQYKLRSKDDVFQLLFAFSVAIRIWENRFVDNHILKTKLAMKQTFGIWFFVPVCRTIDHHFPSKIDDESNNITFKRMNGKHSSIYYLCMDM